jgi:hypothetical protein
MNSIIFFSKNYLSFLWYKHRLKVDTIRPLYFLHLHQDLGTFNILRDIFVEYSLTNILMAFSSVSLREKYYTKILEYKMNC